MNLYFYNFPNNTNKKSQGVNSEIFCLCHYSTIVIFILCRQFCLKNMERFFYTVRIVWWKAIRNQIYTNANESFNRQLRKVTKSKTIFLSDDSLMKMLYLATMDITKKMDRTPPWLGSDPFPAGNLLWRKIILIIAWTGLSKAALLDMHKIVVIIQEKAKS